MSIKGTYSGLKAWAHKNSESSNLCLRIIGKLMIKTADFLRSVKMCIKDKRYRSERFMQILHPKRVHQTSQVTCMNRYPDVFSTCKRYFEEKGKKEIKILSFGCCTGEEVVTLRAYFPEAQIVGADINARSLRICRERELDEKISFVKSSHKRLKKEGPFDAVFCMAVLQRLPHVIESKNIVDLSDIYPFEKFEKQIAELDEYVKEDGLLVLYFTQYDFSNTEVSAKYETYGNCEYVCGLFDKNNKLVDRKGKRNSIFIKSK